MSQSSDPVVIVSCDTHIGPRLAEDLRAYCPKEYLDDFDAFTAVVDGPDSPSRMVADLIPTKGHYDAAARLEDLNQDGTAAEVLFHGSQNGQPVPFNISDASVGGLSMGRVYDTEAELAGVGRHIYNAWLADYCSIEPERHVGLAHLPMWDIEAAIEELTWAREHGLRGVNFPAESGPGESTKSRWSGKFFYQDPVWEPFWAACEDLGMTLATHGGAGTPTDLPGGHSIWLYEAQEDSRKPIHRLIFSGVFDRHPDLKYVITEAPGNWWYTKMLDLDSATSYGAGLEMKPSEYMRRNVFLGASFQARFEAEDALEHGYTSQCLWGTDYPHVEGTWRISQDPDVMPVSQQAMRYTYHGFPEDVVRDIAGFNACRVYGLDADALAKVSARINAPSFADLDAPLDEIPAEHGMWAFRQQAAFA